MTDPRLGDWRAPELPAIAGAGSPRGIRILARLMAVASALIVAGAFVLPWQQSVRGTGRVIAFNPLDRRVNVEAPVQGRVRRLHVVENQVVKKGEPLVELVKKVGGFRIGALPSFLHAHESGQMREMLRKLAPYAQAMTAEIRGFDAKGEHTDWSLESCIETLRAVGFNNMLSLEWSGKGEGTKHLIRAREVLTEALRATEIEQAEEEEAA